MENKEERGRICEMVNVIVGGKTETDMGWIVFWVLVCLLCPYS